MVITYRRLNLFMAKPGQAFEDLLADAPVVEYPIPDALGIDGVLYVRESSERRPNWGSLLNEVAGCEIPNLVNQSSSAVLLLRVDGDIFAFVFGYGRYLIEQSLFVQDFGIRTALNTLDDKSLRSVDLHTLEDQPVQKKSQAARNSEVSVFGIDILRDVLRAVTGAPKPGVVDVVDLVQITGGDAMFSFGVNGMVAADFPSLARRIKGYYDNDDYRTSFPWVDNVRKVKDNASVNALNERLIQAVSSRNPEIMITLPELGTWDTIQGFSFTRNKDCVRPVIDSADY